MNLELEVSAIIIAMDNQELLNIALKTAQKAYAPYSNFLVGSAVELENGEIFSGCNVENASYGLTLCAERNAISTAISSSKFSKIKKIAIASPNTQNCFPCGACRQWIDELSEDATIIIQSQSGLSTYKISELLPNSFGQETLK